MDIIAFLLLQIMNGSEWKPQFGESENDKLESRFQIPQLVLHAVPDTDWHTVLGEKHFYGSPVCVVVCVLPQKILLQ